MLSDWDSIQSEDSSGGITFYNGKHMTVLEHPSFPGVIIKITSSQHALDMLESVKKSQAICEEHKLSTCFIPESRVILLDPLVNEKSQTALFIMEKVKGTISPQRSREQSESAFEEFSSSFELEAKWRKYFLQATHFICLTGYWDTSWKNILLMENGFGYVDFEGMEPIPRLQKIGIERLLAMAPPQFYKMIFDTAVSHHVFTGEQESEILKSCETHTEDLKLRSQVRAWHKEHKVSAAPIPLTNWQGGTLERTILEKFISECATKASDYEGSLIDQRKIWWDLPGRLQGSKFNQALVNLQNAGLLCTWTTAPASRSIYSIYF